MSEQHGHETAQVPSSILHFAGYKAMTWLASRLPLKTQYKISAVAADLYYKLDRRARENVCENLRVIRGEIPPAGIRSDARKVFRSFGRYLCEFFGCAQISGVYIDRHVMVHGREHLDAALKAGRGALFCSGHYSNFELGAWVVAHMGYPVTAIVLAQTHPKVNELFVKQRAERGVKVVHSHDGVRAAMRALRENKTLAILGDRPTGGPTVDVSLFGRRTRFPQGPWRIAAKTGAALLPTFVTRDAENNYILEIKAPIQVSAYNPEGEQVQQLAQAWATCLEATVRNDPTQWKIFYRIWDREASD